MKTTLTIIALSAGLLWGCQEKVADQNKPQSQADHEMTGKMDHDHNEMSMSSEGDKMDHEQMNQADHIAYYTCPMESHKHIHSSEPGSCPECGMAMVAVTEISPDKADYYGCPMAEHSHVRADEAGQCPECGMNLKPYKLEKTDS